ncbi:MAG: hypothetical protein KGL18_15015, partial [Burkholderiales bacterium]|nr:hypothetical protein [Burkholderiales bacterium]
MNPTALHTTPFSAAPDRRWPFPTPRPVLELEPLPGAHDAGLCAYAGEIVRISGGSARARQALLLAAAAGGARDA